MQNINLNLEMSLGDIFEITATTEQQQGWLTLTAAAVGDQVMRLEYR